MSNKKICPLMSCGSNSPVTCLLECCALSVLDDNMEPRCSITVLAEKLPGNE